MKLPNLGVSRGFWLVAGAILLDRFLKALALSGAEAGGATLRFELFRNSGIAFSLPFSGPGVWILSTIIICLVLTVFVRDLRTQRTDRLPAMGLFVLGAASNLFDRIAYGFTVDYLIFFQRSAVNVADGMILAGALWLAFAKPLPSKANP